MSEYTYQSDHAVSPADRPLDRVGALWRGKWWVLGATIIVGAATLFTTRLVAPTYSSSVQVSFTASPASGSSAGDLATAGNELAAQYAQLVTTAPVLAPAAAAAGTTTAQLASHTSSGTLASQNVIDITVQSPQASAAQREATAVATSLSHYALAEGEATATAYTASINAQLAPLDAQIAKAQTQVTDATIALAAAGKTDSSTSVAASSATLNSAQSLLTDLEDRRAALNTQATLDAASLVPTVTVLGAASGPAQTSPKPKLYTVIATVLALLISSQLVIQWADRRRRFGRG